MPNSNENGFIAKMKHDKGARAIAITVAAMLLVLTAIIITTVIANRSIVEEPLEYRASEPAGLSDPEGTEGPTVDKSADPDPVKPDENKQETPTDTLPERFLLPVSGVLLKGHDAEVQVFSSTMGDYRVHLGIDIGTVAGANVCAMADGVIAQVWEDVSMGQCVAIKHSGGAYSIYKNLSPELAERTKAGNTVKAGDVIGTVGESAMAEIAEEPHLHLEMTVNDLQVDPRDYLDAAAIATLNEDTNYEDVS